MFVEGTVEKVGDGDTAEDSTHPLDSGVAISRSGFKGMQSRRNDAQKVPEGTQSAGAGDTALYCPPYFSSGGYPVISRISRYSGCSRPYMRQYTLR